MVLEVATVVALLSTEERIELCKLLAREVPTWQRFVVDVCGHVYFREAEARKVKLQALMDNVTSQLELEARLVEVLKVKAESAQHAAEEASLKAKVAKHELAQRCSTKAPAGKAKATNGAATSGVRGLHA